MANATHAGTAATRTRTGTEADRVGPLISGWTMFSGVVLLMAGIFGAVNGLIALLNDEVYAVTSERVVLFDFTQWGWIHTIGGALVALAAVCVMSTAATWARVLGVLFALVQAIGQVAFIEAYPFWTLSTIALDVLVIYGLMIGPANTENA